MVVHNLQRFQTETSTSDYFGSFPGHKLGGCLTAQQKYSSAPSTTLANHFFEQEVNHTFTNKYCFHKRTIEPLLRIELVNYYSSIFIWLETTGSAYINKNIYLCIRCKKINKGDDALCKKICIDKGMIQLGSNGKQQALLTIKIIDRDIIKNI